MGLLNKYRDQREAMIKKSLGKISDQEYLAKAEKGRWVTTEDGNRAFLGGDGKLAYTREEIASKEEKGGDLSSKKPSKKDIPTQTEKQALFNKFAEEYYKKDSQPKEVVKKRGLSEKSAKIELSKLGGKKAGYKIEVDDTTTYGEGKKYKISGTKDGDAQGLSLDEYKKKYKNSFDVLVKNTIEHNKEVKSKKEPLPSGANPLMEKQLKPFKDLAQKHAGDVKGFMDAVRKVNNVPGAVSKYFSDVYGQKGELSMEQTAKVFMDIHGKK